MKLKLFCVAFLVLATTFYTSCSKSHSPLAPASTSFTTVKVPLNTNGHVSVVNSYSLDYTITGTGVAPVTGNIGPIPNSQIINGFYSFTLDLTSTSYDLFSAVVNDAQAQTVCAVGAQSFTYLAGSTIPVTIGPINPCYTVTSLQPGYTYGFEGNTTTNVGVNQPTSIPGLDMVCNQPSLGVNLLENASLAVNTVAYLGNGNWSSYLTVPPTTSFYVSSGQSKGFVTAGNPSAPNSYPAAVGDVYCVKILAGGYAWLQVTSITGGLSFIFRPNTTLSYCGYERTTSDIAGLCNAAATPTNTSVVTNTFTATLTPTNTPIFTNTSTPTFTLTNTSAFTNTSTATSTPTNTPVNTNTSTATLTPTNTSIFTSTFTSTDTATNTPLNTNTSTPTSSPTNTAVNTNTFTSTYTATNTSIFTSTFTPTDTSTNTPLNTNTSTSTNTPSDTATNTVVNTSTNTATTTATDTATATWTATAVSTATNTSTNTVTNTPTSTSTPTPSSGVVISLAGQPGTAGTANGLGTAAQFNYPDGVALDGSGNLYVADYNNNMIREVSSAGLVTTFAGNGTSGLLNGPATSAEFNKPEGVAVDSSGNVYVADFGNNVIREISGGNVTTLAGTGIQGSQDNVATAATFYEPAAVAVNAAGTTIYVADYANCEIRAIYGGSVTTLAGQPGSGGFNNGIGTAALFNYPMGIAVDTAGNLYIGDTTNDLIREMSPGAIGGTVSTFAGGTPQAFGSTNGPATSASFHTPEGIAIDTAGNVFVADSGNQLVREISAGNVTTLAGNVGVGAYLDGVGTAAEFFGLTGVAVDASDNVYVGDTQNDLIRKIN